MNSQKSTAAGRPAVKRRQKGEKRMVQIIEAAEQVLVERGYEGSNTNLIASRAGISPGSLYQFFRNKDEIYQELAARYAEAFGAALDHAFLTDIAVLTVDAMVDRIVDTLIAVNVAHPGLRSVFRGWDTPPGLAAAIAPLRDGIVNRVQMIVARRLPAASPHRQRMVAIVTTEIFRSLAPLALLSPEPARTAFVTELKQALSSYIRATEARDTDSLVR